MKARAINFKQFIYFCSRVGSDEKRTTGRSLRMEGKKMACARRLQSIS